MKNTSAILSCVVVCVGLFGCAPAVAPRSSTAVVQEADVKVHVDAEGRSHVGAGQTASADAGKAP